MTTEVGKMVFQHRQIQVHLDDGTPPWPLRLNEAVQRYIQGLVTEVEDLRPVAAEMDALREQAERAGESPADLLTGMTRTIETLLGTIAAERDAARQKIGSPHRAISAGRAAACAGFDAGSHPPAGGANSAKAASALAPYVIDGPPHM